MSNRDAILELERERRAAEALRDALFKMPGMDDETVRDTIEGETGLHEAVAEVVSLITETEVMIHGLAAKITQFNARQARYENRLSYLRAAVEQAMTIGGADTIELPDCTLSLVRRAAGLVITDEARIPAAFWKQPDPVIDKAAIKAALKDKQSVPGATLGNGSVSLAIRRA